MRDDLERWDDLGQWMADSMGKIHLSGAAKDRLTDTLAKNAVYQQRDDGMTKKHWFKKTTILALAAACALVLAVAASATVLITPILRGYYENSAGYRQSSIEVGKSVTRNGWTLTLTDCVADDYNLRAGIEVAAPAGTILNAKRGHHFEIREMKFPGGGIFYDAEHMERVKDENLPENTLRYIFTATFDPANNDSGIDGRQVRLKFGNLYHLGEWDEKKQWFERIYDCREKWTFPVTIQLSPDIIRLEPNLPVTTLGVEATITKVVVSPFGAYVYIEGDALSGHHEWVPKNAPDGWYGCVEYQEITLRFIDGTEIPLTGDMAGSICGGGERDFPEPAFLHWFRRADTLIDMDMVQSLFVCGVEIPLR